MTLVYPLLIFFGQDLTKRLERNVDDHRHYEDARQAFENWVLSAKNKMAAFRQMDCDREDLRKQLLELQVFLSFCCF